MLNVRRDVDSHHVLLQAAALSYYLVLSVFPALILLSAIVSLIPAPQLFGHLLGFMSKVLPAETMSLTESVLLDVLSGRHSGWFSFGMIGTIWVTSSAFDAVIEALNMAYEAKDPRPFWKTRLLAIALAAMVGGLLLSALLLILVGPRIGEWLASLFYMSRLFPFFWPVIRWTIAAGFTILAVELLYFLAPYVKQRFAATLPGAVFTVSCWLVLSYLLGFYVHNFANFSHTYGTLAGFIAFMVWFYWNSLALLLGAALNAELAKESEKGRILPREPSDSESAEPAD